MPIDDDFGFPFASGGDHKDVVPVLKQIERNTRLLSAAKPSRGGDQAGALSSPPSSTAKAHREAKATAKSRASGNVAASARTTADAVARGVTKGFQAALENTAAQLSEAVQGAAKTTAEAQKKANTDLVRQQKKLATGPKSAEALNRYREKGRFAATSKENAARFG
ncbi:hypothetical protein [Desulfovibrio sp. DV]|uniref:hypothetical protein n=1 Tax=Desulfovibrio sp. DV TaxID=1844708 RepID=UPI00094B8E71|nr:hypothetical protein [Desulfovibrio sp. DV]